MRQRLSHTSKLLEDRALRVTGCSHPFALSAGRPEDQRTPPPL
jgi:hypothetical protein